MPKSKETEVGIIPSDWDVGIFDEDLKVQGRIGWKGYKTSDLVPVGPYVIGGTEIKSKIFLDLSNAQCLSREKYDESPEIMLRDGDVLLVTRGNLGEVGYYHGMYGEGTINPSVIILNNFKGDSKFLYYYLTSRQGNANVMSLAGGSSVPAIYQADIKELKYPKPSLEEQKQISEVTFSIDLKIDLLHRQNKTLEQLSETLFRQWFVEEVNDTNVKLVDVVKTSSGGTPSRSKMEYYSNGTIKWVKSKELQGGFIFETEETVTDEALINSSAKLFPANTILIAMYGATVGEYGILAEPATCNQAICALIPNENYPYTFLFVLTKFNKENLINMAGGSAQQNISQELIQELEIPKSEERIKKFHIEAEPMFQKIKSNTIQIRTLTQLRDTLLPKLMSGEIRVR